MADEDEQIVEPPPAKRARLDDDGDDNKEDVVVFDCGVVSAKLPSQHCCLTRLKDVYPLLGIDDRKRPRCSRFLDHLINATNRQRYLLVDHQHHYRSQVLTLAASECMLHCYRHAPATKCEILFVALSSPVVDHDVNAANALESVLRTHLDEDDEQSSLKRVSRTNVTLGRVSFTSVAHRQLDSIRTAPTILLVDNVDYMMSDATRGNIKRLLRGNKTIGVATRFIGSDKLFEHSKSEEQWMTRNFSTTSDKSQ